MFAKLKKKLAEEASIAPRSAGRIPRSISKESITSAGADSGDDFASDGSSSRDDLSSQLLRRNDLIRKLEAKLSDYAEQLRVLQKTKEKLEIALENHQDSSLRKLQDQNETYQASRAKMAEGMALALAKKDQEWMEKVAVLEKEKAELSSQLDDLTEQRLSLFQKRDDLDELEGFQRQELAKLKHMLLRKEEQVSQREQELERQASKLHEAHTALAQAQDKIRLLEEAQQESPRLNLGLQAEREKFLGLRAEDEKKISELEARSQQLQDVIQQVTQDFQKSRGTVAELERTISSLQAEHEALKLQHEQHRQKAAVAEEEKERLVLELQEKVSLLKRRLQGNLTEDEHLEELLKEKSALEQKVEETRAELVEARTSHTNEVSSLEAQVRALEQQVLEFQTTLKSNEQQAIDREAHLQMLQAEWSVSSECLRKKDQETVARLEAQVTMVEVARDIDRSAAQHRISELELEEEMLVQARDEAESELRRLAAELEQARAELNSRQMVSLEVAKSLEVMTRQKEELQEQVGETTSTLKAREDELATVTEQLVTREAELHALREELQVAGTNLAELQAEVERQSRRAQECEAQLEALGQEALTQNQQVSDLEAEVETLTEQLRAPALCRAEQNGVVAVDDLARVQRINRELEQQLSEKNKTIKQLQQRHAELKRTLQKELKLRPEAEAEGKEKRQEAKADKPERPSRLCPEAPGPGPPGGVVTNNTDLSDGREINFEYLKHVVLKFMSSRETEAYQLIRAVSVLLNFTREEEAMLKETLEYKMSWFGSKPSPRGIVRPSISGASTHWR